MIRIIISVVINITLLYILSIISNHFQFSANIDLVIFASVLSFSYIFLKPVIKFLAFPVTLVTLGLANVFINLGLVWFVDHTFSNISITVSGLEYIYYILGISIITSLSNKVVQ